MGIPAATQAPSVEPAPAQTQVPDLKTVQSKIDALYTSLPADRRSAIMTELKVQGVASDPTQLLRILSNYQTPTSQPEAQNPVEAKQAPVEIVYTLQKKNAGIMPPRYISGPVNLPKTDNPFISNTLSGFVDLESAYQLAQLTKKMASDGLTEAEGSDLVSCKARLFKDAENVNFVAEMNSQELDGLLGPLKGTEKSIMEQGRMSALKDKLMGLNDAQVDALMLSNQALFYPNLKVAFNLFKEQNSTSQLANNIAATSAVEVYKQMVENFRSLKSLDESQFSDFPRFSELIPQAGNNLHTEIRKQILEGNLTDLGARQLQVLAEQSNRAVDNLRQVLTLSEAEIIQMDKKEVFLLIRPIISQIQKLKDSPRRTQLARVYNDFTKSSL